MARKGRSTSPSSRPKKVTPDANSVLQIARLTADRCPAGSRHRPRKAVRVYEVKPVAACGTTDSASGNHREQPNPERATVPVRVQRHLAALSAPSAPAVGGRLPTGDGPPLRGLERDHRGDDHGRRLNRRMGQDVSSKPTAHQPESSHRPIRLAQLDNASSCTSRRLNGNRWYSQTQWLMVSGENRNPLYDEPAAVTIVDPAPLHLPGSPT
jgi:hypothetical protein